MDQSSESASAPDPSDLYAELLKNLTACARSLAPDLSVQEAEDLVQEVLARGCKNVRLLTACPHEPRCARPADCATAFPKWARGALEKKLMELWKRRARERALPGLIATEARRSTGAATGDAVSGEEIRRFVESVLITPRQCQVFCSRVLDDLGRGEVAELMGISKKTVDKHFRNAKTKLRDVLEPRRALRDWPWKDR